MPILLNFDSSNANQSVSFASGGSTYNVSIRSTKWGMYLTADINGTDIVVNSARLLVNANCIVYDYLNNLIGGFVLQSTVDELPDYTKLGSEQNIYFFTPDEVMSVLQQAQANQKTTDWLQYANQQAGDLYSIALSPTKIQLAVIAKPQLTQSASGGKVTVKATPFSVYSGSATYEKTDWNVSLNGSNVPIVSQSENAVVFAAPQENTAQNYQVSCVYVGKDTDTGYEVQSAAAQLTVTIAPVMPVLATPTVSASLGNPNYSSATASMSAPVQTAGAPLTGIIGIWSANGNVYPTSQDDSAHTAEWSGNLQPSTKYTISGAWRGQSDYYGMISSSSGTAQITTAAMPKIPLKLATPTATLTLSSDYSYVTLTVSPPQITQGSGKFVSLNVNTSLGNFKASGQSGGQITGFSQTSSAQTVSVTASYTFYDNSEGDNVTSGKASASVTIPAWSGQLITVKCDFMGGNYWWRLNLSSSIYDEVDWKNNVIASSTTDNGVSSITDKAGNVITINLNDHPSSSTYGYTVQPASSTSWPPS